MEAVCVSTAEGERTARLIASLRKRVTNLEAQLFEAEQSEDEVRTFAMNRVDELTALGAWVPGQSEQQTREWREQHFMW